MTNQNPEKIMTSLTELSDCSIVDTANVSCTIYIIEYFMLFSTLWIETGIYALKKWASILLVFYESTCFIAYVPVSTNNIIQLPVNI